MDDCSKRLAQRGTTFEVMLEVMPKLKPCNNFIASAKSSCQAIDEQKCIYLRRDRNRAQMARSMLSGNKEPLIKSSVYCVAGKMRMDARRATKVVASTTKPRSVTTQTRHFAATPGDDGFPGSLLCRSACQGKWPLAAPRFAHTIPESRRRNHVGLNQRFPNV